MKLAALRITGNFIQKKKYLILINSLFLIRAKIAVFDGKKYYEAARNHIFDPTQRKVLFARSRLLYGFMEASRGEFKKRLIAEPIQERFCGVSFPRNHKFYEPFNRKITQLIKAGITEKYIKDNIGTVIDPKYYEKPRLAHKKYLETTWRKSFIDEPKVLSMKDLKFGFVIWLGLLVLPLICFILEWLKLLKHFVIMKFILAAYFERKQAEGSKNAEKRTKMFHELKLLFFILIMQILLTTRIILLTTKIM
jgi:hypothetical protein